LPFLQKHIVVYRLDPQLIGQSSFPKGQSQLNEPPSGVPFASLLWSPRTPHSKGPLRLPAPAVAVPWAPAALGSARQFPGFNGTSGLNGFQESVLQSELLT
jgi:hypothetical protein